MGDEREKELSGSGRIFFRCIGIQVEIEAAAKMHLKKAAAQASDIKTIADQGTVIEGELVEDVTPAECEKLEEI